MSEAFDAYYMWLAIPRDEQPPHRYRLLGVRLFENNPDVIESAADQRMAHVRTFQCGSHSALSQQLLNEIAAARVHLLNPVKKAAYDESLRLKLTREEATLVRAARVENEPPLDLGFDVVAASNAARARPRPLAPKKKLPPWIVPMAIAAAVVVCAGIVAISYVLTRDDPTGRFVLLQAAKDVAVEAGEGNLAFEVIDVMARDYHIDGPEMKEEVLARFIRTARSAGQREALAQAALPVIDEAIAEENFTLARKLAKMVDTQAKLARNADLAKQSGGKQKEITAAEKALEQLQDAMATLKSAPSDPEANLAVGKYVCFVKGDWNQGLRMLALGDDPALKALAEKDIKGAMTVEEQVRLGNDWWDLGAREHILRVELRAVYWLEKALPNLKGLARDAVETKILAVKRTVYLADLTPTSFQVGIGPTDTPSSAGMDKHTGGHKALHGLYAHPPASNSSSRISYNILGNFRQLSGDCRAL